MFLLFVEEISSGYNFDVCSFLCCLAVALLTFVRLLSFLKQQAKQEDVLSIGTVDFAIENVFAVRVYEYARESRRMVAFI